MSKITFSVEIKSRGTTPKLDRENKATREMLERVNDASMDWQVNKQQGKNRHYINNEVLGLASISFQTSKGMHYSEAINIVIERLDNQPIIEEVIKDDNCRCESNKN